MNKNTILAAIAILALVFVVVLVAVHQEHAGIPAENPGITTTGGGGAPTGNNPGSGTTGTTIPGQPGSTTGGTPTTPTSPGSPSTPPTPPTPAVPTVYQSLYNSFENSLTSDQSSLSAWNNSTYPVDYSWAVYRGDSNAGLSLISQLQTNPPLAQVDQELDEDKAMGLKAVSVTISYPLFDPEFYSFDGITDNSQNFIKYYVQLAQDIRSRGMKVLVESNTLLTTEAIGGKAHLDPTSYYKSLSLSQYETRRTAMEVQIAQQIKPDYLILQTEPDTDAMNAYQSGLNDPTTDVQMISQIATAISDANIPGLHSSIKIGSGVGTWLNNWNAYITDEIALTGPASLDFIDTHVYSISGNGTLGNEIKTASQIADMAHAANKGAGISEFWLNKTLHNGDPLGDFRARALFSFWEPIDEQFLLLMTQLANYKKLDYLSVGQNYFYASYVDYNSSPCQPAYPATSQAGNATCDAQITATENKLASQAITAGQLSPTAESYKEDISKY